MIGITLLLLANDNKLIELIGIVITIISMGFVIVNDFSVLNPSISLITIGVVLLIANKQIRKKIAIIFILSPIICYLVGFFSFVFLAINLPLK